jgi:N-acetylmuramoyl-L-alanine amidase
MNSFPEEKYSGLQVYYSKNDPMSRTLAEGIQSDAKLFLDPDNTRRAKEANSSIYLLDRLECPAVMVECGFLSNSEERALLCDGEYRRAIAMCIASSVAEQINLSMGK